ncbi:SCO family protein [Myroides sp. 1354]|uniref:SCO family protein n=1 Tax=unclassified Myroides TaxID=2642485 RepID=UPI0025788F62|nr:MULTISPECIES: SCO family protein [unclassified Myroides]MDM1044242.1 SCO family protein [Myroides sp. R163-1]MDM1055178.1 SCO family protein [Myroides sp. 1354]MDM1068475.1 SCO family protein [Myroides sp. 1372]
MKDKSYIWISLVVLVFGIWAVPKIIKKFEKSDLLVIGQAPQFELVDQNNKTINNASYKGKVYVVEFFFANCPTICPIMNQNMLKLQDAFRPHMDFGIASITIDPKNDTVEALNAHAAELGVKIPYWHMLTGDAKYIYDLAGKFNLYTGVNPDAPGGFEHSGLFALIDKEGNIRCRTDEHGNPILYYDGTSDDGVKWIKEDIKLLLEE